jgi:hypothetical protein
VKISERIKKFEKIAKVIENKLNKIDKDYSHENELLGISPSEYEIYNISEIESMLSAGIVCK